jgi:thiamine-phosphate pyrophosphorylase
MDAAGGMGEEAAMADRTSADELWRAALDLNRAAAAVDPRAGRLPPLIFMTDPDRTREPWRIAARLPAGAAVIHRGFGRTDATAEARRLREATIGSGALLLIASDADLAVAVGADGVHLPERELDRAPGLRARWPRWLVTGAIHPPRKAPAPEGLDAMLASPVFPAGGTSAQKTAMGVAVFTRFVETSPEPVYALGGVDATNGRLLSGTGACGIAAVDAVLSAWGD